MRRSSELELIVVFRNPKEVLDKDESVGIFGCADRKLVKRLCSLKLREDWPVEFGPARRIREAVEREGTANLAFSWLFAISSLPASHYV